MGEHNKEFCSLLDTAIRDDHPKLAPPTAMLSRGLNAMCCAGRDGGVLPFPCRGVTYRGGGFDDCYRGFFTKGKQYRQPGFLATSFSEAKAQEFLEKAVAYGRQPFSGWCTSTRPASTSPPGAATTSTLSFTRSLTTHMGLRIPTSLSRKTTLPLRCLLDLHRPLRDLGRGWCGSSDRDRRRCRQLC